MALSFADIDNAYLEILARHATVAEQATWAALSESETTESIYQQIGDLPEAVQFVDPVIRLYQGAFDRVPDQEDPNGDFDSAPQSGVWVNINFLRNGGSLQALADAFVNSAEFIALYGSSDVTPALITAYYNNILDRDPSAGEIAAWEALNLSASEILLGFTQSIEFIERAEPSVDALKVDWAEGLHPVGPLPPPPPDFTLESDVVTVDEGNSVIFTLQGPVEAAGQNFDYELTGADITAADIVGGALTGNIELDSNGVGVLEVQLANDRTTEGAETLTLKVADLDASVTVNDTSLDPTFDLTANSPDVVEGDAAVFTLTTTNIDPGTQFAYEISGDVEAADIVGGQLTGIATVGDDGIALIQVDLVADKTTEGPENLTVTVPLADNVSDSVTVNDTSVDPTFDLSVDGASVDEGDAAVFTLTTTNIAEGTEFAYEISGVDAADVVGGQLTGTATVDADGIALIQVDLLADKLTEGTETLTVTVPAANNESAAIDVNDTSLSPTFDLSVDGKDVDEGDAAVFTLKTTNIAEGTQFAYEISGVDAADVVGGQLTGTATVDADGNALIQVDLVADKTTEGAETLTVTVPAANNEAESITVNDTSLDPTFTLSADGLLVEEGDSTVFTLTTTNIDPGTQFAYEISGDVDAADIVGGELTGIATVGSDGIALIQVDLVADKTTEVPDPEILIVTVPLADNVSNFIGVDDTSEDPEFELTADSLLVEEGKAAVFTLTTERVDPGTQFAYEISGDVDAADIVGGELTGIATVGDDGIALIQVDLVADKTTEGLEFLTVTVPLAENEFATIGVDDKSIDPTFVLTSDKDEYNEGESAQFTLTTTNIAEGTEYAYTLSGANINEDDVVGGQLSGVATIDKNGEAVIEVAFVNDLTTEGPEELTVSISGDVVDDVKVTINDTSETPGFVLTLNPDLGREEGEPFFGGIGDDTYTASISTVDDIPVNDLGAGDDINGNTGYDRILITVSDDGAGNDHEVGGFKTESIERFTVTNLDDGGGDVTIDMSDAIGVKDLEILKSIQDVEFQDVQPDFFDPVYITDSHGLDVWIDFDIQALEPEGQELQFILDESDVEDLRVSQNRDNDDVQAGPVETIRLTTTGLPSSIQQIRTDSVATALLLIDGVADLLLGGNNEDGLTSFHTKDGKPGEEGIVVFPDVEGDWLGEPDAVEPLPGLERIDASGLSGDLTAFIDAALAATDDDAAISFLLGTGDDLIVFEDGAFRPSVDVDGVIQEIFVDDTGGDDEVVISGDDLHDFHPVVENPDGVQPGGEPAVTRGVETITTYQGAGDDKASTIWVDNFLGIQTLRLADGYDGDKLQINDIEGNDKEATSSELHVVIDSGFKGDGFDGGHWWFNYDIDEALDKDTKERFDEGTPDDHLILTVYQEDNGAIDSVNSLGFDKLTLNLPDPDLTIKEMDTPNLTELVLNVDAGSSIFIFTGEEGDTSKLAHIDGTDSKGHLVLADNPLVVGLLDGVDDYLDPAHDLVVSEDGVTFLGGSGNDRFEGNLGVDTISGNDGDDILFGGKGNDIISGGGGQDTLLGGDGDDELSGGGNDVDPDTDLLLGDTLRGGAGNDTLKGDAGNDILRGEAGNDIVDGGSGADNMWGDSNLGGTWGRREEWTITVDTETPETPDNVNGQGDTFSVTILHPELDGNAETVTYTVPADGPGNFESNKEVGTGLFDLLEDNKDLDDAEFEFTDNGDGSITVVGPTDGSGYVVAVQAQDNPDLFDIAATASTLTFDVDALVHGDTIKVTIDSDVVTYTHDLTGTPATTDDELRDFFVTKFDALGDDGYEVGKGSGTGEMEVTDLDGVHETFDIEVSEHFTCSVTFSGVDVDSGSPGSPNNDGDSLSIELEHGGTNDGGTKTEQYYSASDFEDALEAHFGVHDSLLEVNDPFAAGGDVTVSVTVQDDDNAGITFADIEPDGSVSEIECTDPTGAEVGLVEGTPLMHDDGQSISAEEDVEGILTQDGGGKAGADTFHVFQDGTNLVDGYAEPGEEVFDVIWDFNRGTGAYVADEGDLITFGGPDGSAANFAEIDGASIVIADDLLGSVNSEMDGTTIYVNVVNVAFGGWNDLLFADTNADGFADAVASVMGVAPGELNNDHIT